MAKADVTLKFKAEDAEFIQRVFKQKEAYEAAGKSAREMSLQVAQAGDKVAGAGAKMKGSTEGVSLGVAAISTGFLALEKVADQVGRVVSENFERMKQKADSLRDSVQSLTGVLAAAGQVEAYGKVKAELQNMESQTVGQRQREALFARIKGKGGANVSANDSLEATKFAVDFAKTGANNLGEAGETYQALRKYFPKASAEELASMTTEFISAKPGGIEETDSRALGKSDNPMETLNRIVAGAGSDQNAKALERIESLTEKEPSSELLRKSRRERHRLTDAEKSELALAAIPKEQRFQEILKNPNLAPEEDRRIIRAYALKYKPNRMQKAVGGNKFGRSVDQYDNLKSANPDVQQVHDLKMAQKSAEDIKLSGEFEETNVQTNYQNWRNKNSRDFGTGQEGFEGTVGDALGAARDLAPEVVRVQTAVSNPTIALLRELISAVNNNTNQTKPYRRPDLSNHPMENK